INFNLDLDNWNTANVRNMSFAFKGATLFNGDISTWNTANVFTMRRMFRSASAFNGDISQWNTSNVQDMSDMLRETDFNQNLEAWDISSVTTMENMLFASRMSVDNYDDTLIGWERLDPGETRIPRNITFGAGNRRYCRSEIQRQSLIDRYRWTISDGNINPNCSVVIAPKVYLQGAALNPNVGEENLMRDDLRVAGIIPVRSPYPDLILREATLFDVTGNDALVDWVWVELREATDNTTVIAAQSALLQRDGDVVDVDGTSPLSFLLIANRNYFVTIKHRNHLGIMSASAIRLLGTATTVDFTDGTTLTFGSNAQTSFGMPAGTVAMWTGNANDDTIIQYSGTNPDTPEILSEILNDAGNFLNLPTFTISGYTAKDINMDGSTQYSGTNPDTPIILQNVLAHPGNFLNFSTYQITEQLPNTN
ncbi:MAG: BspA family leucine-rich repeat surface protein, partial [Bacteroidota bacterium]